MKKIFILLPCILLLLFSFFTYFNSKNVEEKGDLVSNYIDSVLESEEYVAGKFLVRFNEGVSDLHVRSINHALGNVEGVLYRGDTMVYEIEVKDGDVKENLKKYLSSSLVSSIDPVYISKVQEKGGVDDVKISQKESKKENDGSKDSGGSILGIVNLGTGDSAEIYPEEEDFDLSYPHDVNTTITLNDGVSVETIKNGTDELAVNTDYEIVDIDGVTVTLTIKKTYLESLTLSSDDTVSLEIEFQTNDSAIFTVTAIKSAVINPGELEYDIYEPENIETTITWNQSSSSIGEIKNGDVGLTVSTDYEVNSDKLVIKPAYLVNHITSLDSEITLKITFNNGAKTELKIKAVPYHTIEMVKVPDDGGDINYEVYTDRDETQTPYVYDPLDKVEPTDLKYDSDYNLVLLASEDYYLKFEVENDYSAGYYIKQITTSGLGWGSATPAKPNFLKNDSSLNEVNPDKIEGDFTITANFSKYYEVDFDILTLDEDEEEDSENTGGSIIAKIEVEKNEGLDEDLDDDINISSGDEIADGTVITFTATPEEDYIIKYWKVDGDIQTVSGGTNPLTSNTLDVEVDEGVLDVEVTFIEGISHPVNFSIAGTATYGILSATVDGSTIPSGYSVPEGSTVVFTATPNLGYEVKEWKRDEVKVSNNVTNTFTIANVADEVTITVEFKGGILKMYVNSSFSSSTEGWNVTHFPNLPIAITACTKPEVRCEYIIQDTATDEINLSPTLANNKKTADLAKFSSIKSLNEFEIQFGEGNKVSASSHWNGGIILPTILPSPSKPIGANTTISKVVKVGSNSESLIFDKPVRLLLPGQVNNKVGYISPGANFVEITEVCPSDNVVNLTNACKIDVGEDLVVWTKHFTEFVTYTTTELDAGSDTETAPTGAIATTADGKGTALPQTNIFNFLRVVLLVIGIVPLFLAIYIQKNKIDVTMLKKQYFERSVLNKFK